MPKKDNKYPTSVLDLPVNRPLFDPNTLKTVWSNQTIRERGDMLTRIENIPAEARSKEEESYYKQIKGLYLDNYKNDMAIREEIDRYNDDMQMATGGNFIPSNFKWDFSSHPSTSFGKWVDNTIGNWGQKKNETEISTYQGFIDKNLELRQYANMVQEYSQHLQVLAEAEKVYE